MSSIGRAAVRSPAPGTTNLKNFSGNWWGSTDVAVTTGNSAEPGYAAQIPVSAGGTAINPGGAPDIAGSASANIDFTPLLESGTDTAPATPGFQGSTAAVTVHTAGSQVGSTSRIQEGVTAVDAAGIIHVLGGSYTEAVPVTITKSLSLLGPNAGVSPNDTATPLTANAARVAEATIAPSAGQVALQVGAPSVTIDGLRFTDPGTAGASNTAIIGAGGNYGGDASGLAVRNNIFDAVTRIAVYTNGPTTITGVTVDDNRVSNPTRATGCGTGTLASSGCGHQLFNLWHADDASFSRNVVFAPAGNGDRTRVLSVTFPGNSSAQTDGPADNVVIDGNTIRNSCVYTCFSLAEGVTNVAITNNDVEIDTGNIVQTYTNWTGGRVQIDHNEFVAAGGASVIVESAAADLGGITVTRNSMTAGGVANGLAGNISAPCNWWGQANGPLATQNLGAVVASDPLATNDLDAACPVPPATPPTNLPVNPAVNSPEAGTPDFNPVTPTRVFDTRNGTPVYLRNVARVAVGPSTPLEVKLTDLPGGLVPASGVGAVSINVTSTLSVGDGFVSVGPCPATGLVSNVNFRAGSDRANAVITPVSATGTVCFTSSVATDLVVDLNGWFKTAPGFNAVTPTRVFDTRPGTTGLLSVPQVRLVPGTPLEVKFSDLPGGVVPASGVGAVSFNLTSTRSLRDGFVTVSPCTTADAVSSLNFDAGDDAANLVVTPVSATGTVCFNTSAPTDLVVDINGWFTAPSGFERGESGAGRRHAPWLAGPARRAPDACGPGHDAPGAVDRSAGRRRSGKRRRRGVDDGHVHPVAGRWLPHGESLWVHQRGVERQLPGRPRPCQRRPHAGLGHGHGVHHGEPADRRDHRRQRLVLLHRHLVSGLTRSAGRRR